MKRTITGDYCRDGYLAIIDPVRRGVLGIDVLTKVVLMECTHEGEHTWACRELYHGQELMPNVKTSRMLVDAGADDIATNHPLLADELEQCRQILSSYPDAVWFETFWPLILKIPALVDDHVLPFIRDGDLTDRLAHDAARAGLLRTRPFMTPALRTNRDLRLYCALVSGGTDGARIDTEITDIGEHAKHVLVCTMALLRGACPDMAVETAVSIVESIYNVRCALRA